MTELEFPKESFDLIWSEGAIYNMRMQRGLSEWRRFLRPGCCVAVTELTWLTPNPPPIAWDFWHREYPAMASREKNGDAIERANYPLIESFALPEAAWWAFYSPLEERIARLREKYAAGEHAEAAAKTLDEVQREIDIYRASNGSYSYVFYVAGREKSLRTSGSRPRWSSSRNGSASASKPRSRSGPRLYGTPVCYAPERHGGPRRVRPRRLRCDR